MRLPARDMHRAWWVLRQDGVEGFMDQVAKRSRRVFHRLRNGRDHLPPSGPEDALLGMISREERGYLRHYGADEYTGAGAITDLGCWLGASTVNLASGVVRNHRVVAKAGCVHAFDIFRWEGWMEGTVVGTDLAGRYRHGDSFLGEFRRRTEPWSPLITVHPGDLREVGWPVHRPIEFLFNDASKSLALANGIVRDFYPWLLPDRSVCMEQDFAHFYTPWVHLIRLRYRRFFEPVSHIPYSGSAVFRLTRAIPADMPAEPISFSTFSEREVNEAFEDSFRLVSPEMRPNVAAAKVMWYLHGGDPDRARHELRQTERQGLRGGDLIKVKRHYLSER